MKNKTYLIGGAAATAVLLVAAIFAYANPSFYTGRGSTSAATSTANAAMTPGTGTSTLTYDAHQVVQGQNTAFNPTAADALNLAVQFSASSTNTNLRIRIEDSPDNQDWYMRLAETNTNATTTRLSQDFQEYSVIYASSTAGTSVSERMFMNLNVPVRMRYTRAVFYLAPYPPFPYQSTTSPSQNGMIWAEWVPRKERPE